jgi:hypothetical protein
MDQNTQQNLEVLLKEGKLDEARAIIKQVISTPLTDAEVGEAYVALASAYLDATNAADAEYIKALEKAVEGLKAINLEA